MHLASLTDIVHCGMQTERPQFLLKKCCACVQEFGCRSATSATGSAYCVHRRLFGWHIAFFAAVSRDQRQKMAESAALTRPKRLLPPVPLLLLRINGPGVSRCSRRTRSTTRSIAASSMRMPRCVALGLGTCCSACQAAHNIFSIHAAAQLRDGLIHT